MAAAALAAPGDLDPTFDGDGYVVTPVGAGNSGALDVVVQPDGKIVAVGAAAAGSGSEVALVRYASDGSLDPTFGSGGIVVTTIGNSTSATAVVLQSDGKIVVGGSADTGTGTAFMVARYDTAGALDPSFGVGGIVTTLIGTGAGVNALALQSDGRIVAVGTRFAGDNAIALARYDVNGMLDPTFGTAGVTTTVVGTWSEAWDVALLPGDALAIAGTSEDRFVVARYESDGALDAGYGSGGIVTTVVTAGSDFLRAIAAQSDGKLLVAGATALSGIRALTVARYDTTGLLDATFGNGGIVSASLGLFSMGSDLQILPDGKILVGGVSVNPSGPPAQTSTSIALLRYLPSGDPDASFGSGGYVGTSLNDETVLSAVALQPDGRLIVAGSVGITFLSYSHNDLLVARYDVSTCGNDITEAPETCDDGNDENGDGCDVNCTLTGCGNGIVTAGESCDGSECCTASCTFAAGGTACTDDDNECTDDQCDGAGVCAHAPNTLPCDDFSICTANDTCSNGTCVGTPAIVCPACQTCSDNGECIVAPRSGCRGSVKALVSKLAVTDSATTVKNRLTWRWSAGSATSAAELGNPLVAGDGYDLCLFRNAPSGAAGTLVWNASVPSAGVCDGKPCWSAKGGGAFAFHDPTRAHQGVDGLRFKPGPDRKAQISLQAKGANLAAPDLHGGATPLVMQLQRPGGACWQTTLTTGGGRVSGDATKWKFRGQ